MNLNFNVRKITSARLKKITSTRLRKITSTRVRTSYLSSVISTALVLFLLGVVGLLLYNINRLPSTLRDQIAVSVTLDDTLTDKSAMQVLAKIELKEFAYKVEFKSKEDAANEMRAELGNDFIALLGENPLPAKINISMQKSHFTTEKIEDAIKELTEIKGVKDARYQKSLMETVIDNTKKITLLIFIFVALLLFVSVFLINNTIRLVIYSKRFLINTMKLVGASTSFIRTPFLASSVWQGMISGFIAIIMLLGLILFLRNDFFQFLELTDSKMFGLIFALILLLGSLISFVSTYIIVTKYTKIRTDDLWED
ncbi:MAG: permease-like cell division protein FtsX [Prevotellaceae bacterium]|nr:permease-like cell division protein FtsX [Prevotellaceae bacterium]